MNLWCACVNDKVRAGQERIKLTFPVPPSPTRTNLKVGVVDSAAMMCGGLIMYEEVRVDTSGPSNPR